MSVRRKMDPALRRRVMASIKKVNTRPELVVRRALWRAGVRGWRCHVRSLPGTPDLVFRRWRVAVHVDGVWWHGRPDHFWPGRRGPYWDTKIQGNIARDRVVDRELLKLGWTSVRLWDVDILKDTAAAVEAICAALTRNGWKVGADCHAPSADPITSAAPCAPRAAYRPAAPPRDGSVAFGHGLAGARGSRRGDAPQSARPRGTAPRSRSAESRRAGFLRTGSREEKSGAPRAQEVAGGDCSSETARPTVLGKPEASMTAARD